MDPDSGFQVSSKTRHAIVTALAETTVPHIIGLLSFGVKRLLAQASRCARVLEMKDLGLDFGKSLTRSASVKMLGLWVKNDAKHFYIELWFMKRYAS